MHLTAAQAPGGMRLVLGRPTQRTAPAHTDPIDPISRFGTMALLALPLLAWSPPRPTHSIGHGRSRAADPCMASRFRIRSRVASLWRRDAPSELMSTPPAPSAELLPISTVLTMAGVTRPLSDCFNDAIAALAAEHSAAATPDSAPTNARTGVRVGASGEWFVLATGTDGAVVSYTPFGAATPTECDARLSYLSLIHI